MLVSARCTVRSLGHNPLGRRPDFAARRIGLKHRLVQTVERLYGIATFVGDEQPPRDIVDLGVEVRDLIVVNDVF